MNQFLQGPRLDMISVRSKPPKTMKTTLLQRFSMVICIFYILSICMVAYGIPLPIMEHRNFLGVHNSHVEAPTPPPTYRQVPYGSYEGNQGPVRYKRIEEVHMQHDNLLSQNQARQPVKRFEQNRVFSQDPRIPYDRPEYLNQRRYPDYQHPQEEIYNNNNKAKVSPHHRDRRVPQPQYKVQLNDRQTDFKQRPEPQLNTAQQTDNLKSNGYCSSQDCLNRHPSSRRNFAIIRVEYVYDGGNDDEETKIEVDD